MTRLDFRENLVEKGQEIRWGFAELLSLGASPLTKSDSDAYHRATWRRVPKLSSIGDARCIPIIGADPSVTSGLKDSLKGTNRNAAVLGVMVGEIDLFSRKFPELEQGVLIKSGDYMRAAVVPGGFGEVAVAGYGREHPHYAVALRKGANDFAAAPVLTNRLTREVFVPQTTVVIEDFVPAVELPESSPGVPLV